MTNRTKGKVYLVGAGPGRADLITVRGAELLRIADCVIYDRLANPALLKFARADAELIDVGKRAGAHPWTQPEINHLLIEKAAQHKTIIRLKGGDPTIFGRAAEELKTLADAGIEFEIVPGVTAATAAAAYTGIMLTDRDYSSQVVFVTGHEAPDKEKSSVDFAWLARFTGTIVFYMGVGKLDFLTEQLIKNGIKEETTAAVITNATFPTQRTVRTPLREIADKCRRENARPPAIIIIGPAGQSDGRFDWLTKKPLFGRNIALTRDDRGNADFAARIIGRGANPIPFPTIKIEPLTNSNTFLQTLTRFPEYDWIVFTSANGVTIFFEALQSLNKDCRVFASAKIAAIGQRTADQLARFGIKADFVPTVFTGKDLARQLTALTNLQAKNILLLRSDVASKELPTLLQNAKAHVDDVAIYTVAGVKHDSEQLTRDIAAGAVHWITFASPSAVQSFFQQITPDLVNSTAVKVASIGPVTSDQLRKLGVGVDVEAADHTIDGLIAAIEGNSQ